jgi:hypothetical protein
MLLFSSTQHYLFPPDFLFWRFIWKYCVFSLLILPQQSSADLQNSGSLYLMSWHTLLKMSIFLLGVVSNCCSTWSSPHSSINTTVFSWVYESPLAGIALLIINILNNARVFFPPSMRIWSFTLFNSMANCAFTLNVRSMQIRSFFLNLPLELYFFRSILDRFKPLTLDEDRSILHRSSLCRSICASEIFYNDSKYV